MKPTAATAPDLLAALSLATDLGSGLPLEHGSGYHRGCGAAELPRAARPIAAADVFAAMTLPAGADASGVPVGVQLVARPGEEATIVALAGQMERAAEG